MFKLDTVKEIDYQYCINDNILILVVFTKDNLCKL